VPAPLLLVEHDIVTQRVGANANLLAWYCHSRKGAGVPCAPQLDLVRAAPLFHRGCTRATWRRRHRALYDLTTEPPAHIRLVSGHDLFEIVALLDCTAWLLR
jgi:hypothetical protein